MHKYILTYKCIECIEEIVTYVFSDSELEEHKRNILKYFQLGSFSILAYSNDIDAVLLCFENIVQQCSNSASRVKTGKIKPINYWHDK